MVYIEPLELQIQTPGEQLSPSLEEDDLEIPNWSETYNWTLNKLVTDDYRIIDSSVLMETIQDSISDVFDPIKDVDANFAEHMERSATRPWRGQKIEEIAIYNNNDVVILPTSTAGQMYVVSEYKNDVENVLNSFNGRISNFSDVAEDFGLKIDLLSGEAFAQSMAQSLNAEIIEREDFDNSAEEAVYNEIVDRLTTSVDTNVTLRFGNDDPEVFEYDLLLFAGENGRIIVEVKDGSRDEANLDKSDLIDDPRDMTSILKSDREKSTRPWFKELTEVFVIAKHMDDDDFAEQKQKAERRNINLLKYEEGSYLEELEERFRVMAMREL